MIRVAREEKPTINNIYADKGQGKKNTMLYDEQVLMGEYTKVTM